MQFIETPLAGAYVIELDRHEDERGFFARTFCVEEFKARGLDENPARRQDPVAVGMVDNRSSGNYAVAVFGNPGDPNWGWKITGHHPTLDEAMQGMRRRLGVASRE